MVDVRQRILTWTADDPKHARQLSWQHVCWVGNWLVGEHVNAVVEVLGAIIGSCGSFLCGKESGR